MRRPKTPSWRRRIATLDFIVDYKQDHDGVAPTMRDILAVSGACSTSTVFQDLQALAGQGLIVYQPVEARTIEVVGGYHKAAKAREA